MIAANREVDLTMAEQIAEVFTEVVVAPSFTDDAVEVLTGKKNIRLLRLPHLPAPRRGAAPGRRRAAAAGQGPARRAGRRPHDLDAGHRGARWTPPGWTTSSSPGGRCGR